MKCLSLFSGIGGFDLALQRQGHEIVGACEIDRYARQIYSGHFPGVRIYEDATKIQPEEIPDFDILCAGFPCQAFSVAGKRLGFEESRGTLFFEIARIAKSKRPKILLLENVKGLLNHDNGKTFEIIIQTLDELGYDVEWQVLNSKYFVPQNRERIFIIGHLRGSGSRQIFPIGENNETSDEPRMKIIKNSSRDSYRVYSPDGIGRTLRANCGGMGSKTGLISVVSQNGKLRETENSNAIDANYWKGIDNHSQRTAIAVLTPDREKRRQKGRRAKDQGEPMFTLTAQDRHGIFDGVRLRRLTPTECERLQGFPDSWTEGISETQRYKCIGNAVTVPVVEFILQKIRTSKENQT